MSHPIFFSVASNDIITAEQIFDRYASDLIYLYSRNGKNGTWMWQEIEEEELPFSRAFVIFWSKAYLNNTGTRRELAQARRMIENRTLREFLIVRCDDTPLFSKYFDDLDADKLQVFEDLRPFLRHVRADAPRSMEHVNHLVDELVLKVDRPSAPLQPRPLLQEDLKAAARISRFSYHPAVWLSGLNGYGRKTLIREFMREVDPNLVSVIVDIDETSLPSQIHARIRSIAFEESISDTDQLGDENRKFGGRGPSY